MLIIDFEKLNTETLDQLIEEFVLREGTDYGNTEFSLEQKKHHIYKQIKAKQLLLGFDQETETVNLFRKEDLKL